MAFAPGSRIGPYEVSSLIGRGGMGEVYRARDLKLGRDVALKVLPDSFQSDSERISRLEREARVLASLSHPNIATIHGVEDASGVPALVMELVEGVTLAERIALGPMSIDEALPIARQIADALEAAHGSGVVHRDLKPANIKFARGGIVKVLDFGLAKAIAGAGPGPARTLSTTVAAVVTNQGAALGTPGYMSPEQARGDLIDKRVDIWAFGCVLYEMLTGYSVFARTSVAESIAAILEREPDWTRLPPGVPAPVRRLLRRCLEKDTRRRLHDIADARIELEDAASDRTAGFDDESGRGRHSQRRSAWVIGAVALIAAAASIAVMRQKSASPAPSVVRFTIAPAPGDTMSRFPALAISPDGQRIVFVASRGGVQYLFIRDLRDAEPILVSGTNDAAQPFFSPDGQWIAFFAAGKLKKVAISGGVPEILCDAPSARGGSWAPDDTIVFAPAPVGPLVRVSASGGTPTALSHLEEGEASHRWPHVLPDGSAVLFGAGPAATATSWNEARIIAQSLSTNERRVIVRRGTYPRFVAASNQVLFVVATGLFAVPLDRARLETTGPPVRLSERVFQSGAGSATVDVSASGTLGFLPGADPSGSTLAWIDREGKVEPTDVPIAVQGQPRISPDGQRVAYMAAQPEPDIWLYDLERRVQTRLTDDGASMWPIWTPDGKRVTFTGFPDGTVAPYWKPADGSGKQERLPVREGMPMAWSPDGGVLAFVSGGQSTGYDIWTLPLATRTATPYRQTRFFEHEPAFSPNGRWIAYVTNENGRNEVYVADYPGSVAGRRISTDGGSEPIWSHDGRELFYRRDNDLVAVAISWGRSFSASAPRRIFGGRFAPGGDRANYDVTPDGRRFVVIQPPEDGPPAPITVVVNWATRTDSSPVR